MIFDPVVMRGNSVAGFTSVKGRSHTFDARADGYARGEAIDAFACRLPIDDASGSSIHMLGSAVRQDGRSASLTAPNGQAQQGVLGASLADARLAPKQLAGLEAHGTGTALGDPIEAGAVAAVFLSQRDRSDDPLIVGSLKANAGHTEPGAGLAGALKLLVQLRHSEMATNAQLRALNPHVGASLRGHTTCALSTQSAALTLGSSDGGVSSFGYSGTIAHLVLRRSIGKNHQLTLQSLSYERRAFPWGDAPHPFVQRRQPSSDGAVLFRSPAAGVLHALVADHVVQGRVIFPGAGFLELARAAGSAALSTTTGVSLRSVFFLQPLPVEVPGLFVDCSVVDGQFKVRSTTEGDTEAWASDAAVAHCTGSLAPRARDGLQRVDLTSARARMRLCGWPPYEMYFGFQMLGLQYGSDYRTLEQMWADGRGQAAGRLRARFSQQGTQVHPADLDDALCVTAVACNGVVEAPAEVDLEDLEALARLANQDGGGGETRLPFAVDDAMLQGAPGRLWAVVKWFADSEAVSVRLGAVGRPLQAQLDGFKSRALRAKSQTPRHLYVTEWRSIETPPPIEAGESQMLVLSDEELALPDCELVGSATSREQLAARLDVGLWRAAVAAVATQRGRVELQALIALEVALTLVQTRAANPAAPVVWLLTIGAHVVHSVHGAAQAGAWGLARSARVEAQLPLHCADGSAKVALECGSMRTEPEMVLREAACLVPRLGAAPRIEGSIPRVVSGTESHIITGGTNGLGLLTGRWLAQCGPSAVFLASRGGALAHDTMAEWDQLQSSSAVVFVERCDASEDSHVRRLVARALRPSPVAGVWHAAGVLADGVLFKQSASTLTRVYGPKAHGGWDLQLASISQPLRVSTLFSSIAAMLGGAGQTNYSAVNTCLDALAAHSRARGRASVSVQWGAWAAIGMASRGAASERMAAMEAAAGLGRIDVSLGLAALHAAALPQAPSLLGVMPVQWHRMLGGDAPVPAFLSDMAPRPAGVSVRSTSAKKVDRVECTVSLDAVLELAARTAGSTIDADAPLMEAGVDSLGAVELRNQLQRAVGDSVTLSSTLMFDHPTARQVALHLQGNRPGMVEAGDAVHAGGSVAADVEVAGLSLALPIGVASLTGLRESSHCGRDLLTEIPISRWDVEQAAAELIGSPPEVASRVRHGGFMQDTELFEHGFFSISAAEAAAMDPQQRQLLERGYSALHAAGMSKGSLLGAIVAVSVGQWASEFGIVLMGTPAGRSVYAATGDALSVTCEIGRAHV